MWGKSRDTIHEFVSPLALTEGRPNQFTIDNPFVCAQDDVCGLKMSDKSRFCDLGSYL